MQRYHYQQFYFRVIGVMAIAAMVWGVWGHLTPAQAQGSTRYVAVGGTDSGNCSVSTAPCATIQYALGQAVAGDEIRVAAGVYSPVNIIKDITLSGGFTTGNWLTADPVANQTKLDAQQLGRVITISGSTTDAVIQGLHITNGKLTGTNSYGAGVYNDKAKVTLRNNFIYGNSSDGTISSWGAGVSSSSGVITIQQNSIYQNQASSSSDTSITGGGGIGILGTTGSAWIEGNKIYQNLAGSMGGGVATQGNNTTTIQNNLIYDNKTIAGTTNDGGGGLSVANNGGKVYMAHNTLFTNISNNQGGAVFVGMIGSVLNPKPLVVMTNTLIISNTAKTGRGGIQVGSGGALTVTYTTLYSNVPNSHGIEVTNQASNVTNPPAGPQFVDEAGRDFHLLGGAQAIDSGTNAGVLTDFEGNTRPFGSNPDRGAYEFAQVLSCFAQLPGGQTFNSVQQAINVAASGDVIKLAGVCKGVEGTAHNGSSQVVYVTKNVTLRGGYSNSDWNSATHGATLLDANSGGRVVFIETSASQVTLENLIIENGSVGANDGAGVYAAGSGTVTIQNSVLYNNRATRGGAIYNGGTRILTLNHNTFYQNNASSAGGAVYADATSVVTLKNSIIANNSGSGIAAAAAGRFSLAYNLFDSNTPSHYGANTSAAATDLTGAASLVDPASQNFELSLNSVAINQADPTSTLATDFKGAARPVGARADMGAHESVYYLGLGFPPASNTPIFASTVQGSQVTFKHTISSSSKTPTGKTTFKIDLSNSAGWAVALGGGVTSPIEVADGATVSFDVVVTPVGPLTGQVDNQTLITATSTLNTLITKGQTDVIVGTTSQIAPSYNESTRPGEILTYTHILTNNSSLADTFAIVVSSPRGWATLVVPTPTTATVPTVVLGPNASTQIVVQVEVGKSAAQGVEDVMKVTATSQNTKVDITVVNTTTAQATIGPRHVAQSGKNDANNCTQKTEPCRTIAYALTQAASGDEVRMAQGTYVDGDLLISQDISLLGGYTTDFGSRKIDPTNTIIDATFTEARRGLRIQNVPSIFRPVIQGFTIRNAGAPGAGGGGILIQGTSSPSVSLVIVESSSAAQGGGIFIDANGGRPILENVVIRNTTATGRGGGIYLSRGTISLEAITMSNTTANQDGGAIYNERATVTISRSRIITATAAVAGGAIYNLQGTVNLWNSVLAKNKANGGDGGAIYNGTGSLTVLHDTFDGNSATGRGGTIYHNSGILQVGSSIMANGSAPTVGGLFYNSTGIVDYNLYFANANGHSNAVTGTHSLIADPLLTPNHTLIPGSPAIDKGNPNSTLNADMELDQRPKDQGFDIGADEAGSCVVKMGNKIYGSPQEAINAATPGARLEISGICRGAQALVGSGNGTGGTCVAQFVQTMVITKDLILQGGTDITGTFDAAGQGRILTVIGPAKVQINDLYFSNGKSDFGGAIYNCQGTVTIQGGMLRDNQATRSGGAIYNHDGGTVTLGVGITQLETLRKSTVLENNQATENGGAVYNLGSFSSRVVTFTLSKAAKGGAFYNEGTGQLYLAGTTVVSSSASEGAGVYNTGIFTGENSIFAAGLSQNGAGIYNLASTFLARHNTFYLNEAGQGGGIFINAPTSAPIINSNLFKDNTGGSLVSSGTAPQISYNGFTDAGATGQGNLANLTFSFASLDLSSPNYLRLVRSSIPEDKGDPNSSLEVDIDNKPRPANQAADMGASEVGECYVRINGATPTYGSVQYALRFSQPGDELRIAGACRGARAMVDPGNGQTVNQTVFISMPIKLLGGFTPTNFNVSEPKKNPTTLDALGLGRVIYITNSAVVSIANLRLTGGVAPEGAAVYNGSGQVILDSNEIFGNNSSGSGGAFYHAAGRLAVWNNAIYQNTAVNGAGGYNAGSDLTVWHNTFYQNQAGTQGAGLYTENSQADIRNNIFLEDKGPSVIFSAVPLTVDYNDIFGQTGAAYGGSATAGAHAFNINPNLENPPIFDFTLENFSALIDAGDTTITLTHDFEGHLRPGNQGFDLGRDEIPGCKARILRTKEVYGNIQVAIDKSEKNDVIQVVAEPCNGVQVDIVNSKPLSHTVRVDHSITLLGGFDTSFNQQTKTRTTLNAIGLGRAMLIDGAGVITIDNFSFENGNARGLGGGPNGGDAGGALLYLGTGQVVITNSTFLSNTAAHGGAIYVDGTGLTIMGHSRIASNTATVNGGGIYNNGSMNLYLTKLQENKAPEGAGFYNATGAPRLDFGTSFYRNEATGNGGGLYSAAGDIKVWNTIFYENKAANGGGLYLAGGNGQILHDTLHANSVSGQGGGLFIAGGSPTVKNSIFTENKSGSGSAVFGATGTLNYNNFFNNAGSEMAGGVVHGANDMFVDPLFANPTTGDFSLLSDSPMIDRGDVTVNVFNDFDDPANPRPINNAPDLGVDEYNDCLVKLMRTGQIFGQIKLALASAEPGDRLHMAFGRCQENVVINKNITMQGGWLKDFTPPPDGVILYTTIDAARNGRPMEVGAVEATISQVALVNGSTTTSGGGLLSNASNLTLFLSDIYTNTTTENGGGVYIASGAATILANISFNHADKDGGGIYNESATKVSANGGIAFNTAGHDGGGVYNNINSEVNIGGGLPIEGNIAANNGGGVYNNGAKLFSNQKRSNFNQAINGGGFYIIGNSEVVLENLGLTGNIALENGGGMYRTGTGTTVFHHALIRLNQATKQGGGIFNEQSPMSINASIMAENIAKEGGAGVQSSQNVNVSYTLIWNNESVGVVEGAGNIHNQDPLVLESGGDLRPDSPAIGAVPAVASPTEIDRFGEPRPLMCNKDMGRDEFRVFREMAWLLPSGVEKVGGTTQLITHTYVLTNENRNLTAGWPYQKIFAGDIGSGYTETVRLVLTSTRQWSKISRVLITSDTQITIPDDGLSAQFNLKSGQRAVIEVVTAIPAAAKASVDNDPETMDKTYLKASPQYWNRYSPPESCAVTTGDDRDAEWVSPIVTTKVSASYNFVIAPPQQGYAIAGQKITYTHYITNTGNSVDSYLLFAKPGYYASAEIQPSEVTLRPGESRKFIMIVTINQEAAGGLLDRTSAIAQVVLPDDQLPVQGEVINQTTVGYRTGTRYVLFNEGRNSLVDEREGALDPLVVDVPDNNCTQPLIGPCATLEQALEQAAEGDVIKIAAGTYAQTLVISKSVTIQGGNNSNNWDVVPPNHLSFTTYLAPEAGRAVRVAPGQTVTLERLVIQNGKAAGLGGGPNGEDVGGNIFHEGASLTLNTNRVTNGQATLGAGLFSRGGKLTLRNNIFHDNPGGAVYAQDSETRLENNDFYRNIAGTGGAIQVTANGSLVARNNIFAQNGSNSVLAQSGTLDYNLYHGSDSASGGVSEGAHGVTADPMFTDSAATPPNLILKEGSPAIDTGDPTTNVGGMPYDYGNLPRRSGPTTRIDIGAHEFYVAPLFTFIPDNEVVVPLGEQRTFTHTLTNLSNGTDTFNFTLSSPLQWVGFDTTPQTLAPNKSVTLIAVATVPANVPIGTTEVAVITVTSQANAQTLAYVMDTISAGAVPIQLTVDGATTGQAGIPYRFTATAGPARVAQPITYTWEALDLTPIVHTGALSDMVEFTWSTLGPKTITVTAENGQVKTVVYHTINIQDAAVIPLSVELVGATAGLMGIDYEFMATVSPNEALAPFTYVWTASGQAPITRTSNSLTDTVRYNWSTVGQQTINVSVSNAEGTSVASYNFLITAEPQPPTGVTLSGPSSALYNQDLVFVALVSPLTTTQPITYVWEASGLPTQTLVVTNGLQGEVSFNWGLVTGTQRVTVTVSNGSGVTVQATHSVFLSDKAIAPLAVQIAGAQTTATNTPTEFMATVSPNTTSQPLTYTWSTSENKAVVQTNNLTDSVTFSWSSAGLKTITVIAENEGGAVTATYQVQVGAAIPQAPTRVEIIGATAGLVGQPYTFQANVFPVTTTQPLVYSWQATGNPTVQNSGNGVQLVWSTPGTYQVSLTVSNGLGSVTQNFTVIITAQPLPPLSVKLEGITAGLLDTTYLFTATTSPMTTTQMLTYMWQATGNPIVQAARQNSGSLTQNNQLLTSAAKFRWSTQGMQTITVTVMNGAGSATAVYSVNITLEPAAPTAVVISGPTTGETQQNYTFVATVSGPLTTQPLTYRWQATGLGSYDQVNNLEDKIVFNWATAGTKLITVTAINGGGQVVDSHTIALKLANTTLYLPVLLKAQSVATTPTATTQAGTPTATSQANTPTATTQAGTPTATSQANTPTATTQAGTPTATSQAGTPTATSQVNTPTATSQAGTPTATSQVNTPTATSQAGTPTPTVTPDRPPLELPDLVIEAFSVSDLGNGQYQVNVTVRNQSAFAVTVGNNFYLGVYVDQTNVDPPIFWGLQGAWFTAGATRSFSQQFTAATVGGGSHTFIAWVDPYNVVAESNESNNLQQRGGIVIQGINGENREIPIPDYSGPLPTPTSEINEEK